MPSDTLACQLGALLDAVGGEVLAGTEIHTVTTSPEMPVLVRALAERLLMRG